MSTDSDLLEKKEEILNLIIAHPIQCDLIISLLRASAMSPHYDTRADPFPSAYMELGTKEISALLEDFDNIPTLADSGKAISLTEDFDTVELLYWLFTVIDPKSLVHTEVSELGLPIEQQPQFVFAVQSSTEADRAWYRRKQHKESVHAFYGINIENLFSSLTYGLNPNFNTATVPLYGPGLYLTNQMCVSLLFAPFSKTWKHSMLGDKIRVLLLCEVIEDVSKIRRLKRHSPTDPVPTSTCMLIRDPSLVRIKYLFVYTKKFPRSLIFSKKIQLRVLGFICVIMLLYCCYISLENILDLGRSVLPM